MKRWYNKLFLNNIRKAVENYNMIENGDKILIGISGGKDSIFLLYSLILLKENSYINFDIIGLHIDIGLETDMKNTENFLVENNIPYIYENIDIMDKIFNDKKSPCYLCSKMKRGAIARIAKKVGANKITLGHHKTDLVITLLMNLIYTGKLDTFKPISYNEKHNLNLIRPLIYVEENIIEKIVNDENLPLGKGQCPQDKENKRSEIDELLKNIESKYPDFQQKTITAIENFSRGNLWQKLD